MTTCLACSTPAIRALWATFALNSVFTAAQVAGSIISHSLALMGDTGTMCVDSGTYLINIFAEYVRARGASARTCATIDASAAAISVVALVVVCILTVSESVQRIVRIDGNATGVDPPEEVNAQVMFGFTLGNLFIDIGMLGSILLRKRGGWVGLLTCNMRRDDGRVTAAAMRAQLLEAAVGPDGAVSTPSAAAGGSSDDAQKMRGTKGEDLNLCSALSHVLADTLRTVTEMVTSLLIWADKEINGDMADAVAALLVSAVILFVAALIVCETIHLVKHEVLAKETATSEGEVAASSVRPVVAPA